VLLLIPLGATGKPAPRVTLALIALNALLFAWTSRVATRKATAEEAELERVASWTLRIAAREAPSLAALAREQPSSLALLERDRRWRQEVKSEDVRERLEACLEDYRALKASHPFHRFGFVPADITPGRLIAHQFIHADGLHFFFNMLFLWAVGGLLEATLGPGRLLLAYLSGGAMAALAHAAGNPGSSEPAIGASGAVSALIGLFAVRFGREPLRLALVAVAFAAPRIFIVTWPAWIFPGLWLAEQLLFVALGSTLRIAFLAHLGGFAFGAVLALLILAPSERKAPDVQA
jgi:membrane associated rhomboid family serine protease